MANRWTDEPETGEQPKADLNPLLNPVLEENLGRWAQVYFTNPPETRERAVMDLLRELENREHPNPTAATPTPPPPPAAVSPAPAAPAAPAVAKAPCPVCKGENRLDQKFCGFCGSPLQAQPDDNLAAAATPLHAATSAPPAESLSFLGLSSAATDTELDSLRDRSFDMSYYEPDSGRHRGLYITAALIILIGGITYLTWPALLVHLPPAWQEAILRQQPVRTTASVAGVPNTTAPATPTAPSTAESSAETSAAAPTKTADNAAPSKEDESLKDTKDDDLAGPAPDTEKTAANGVAPGTRRDARPVTLASTSQSSRTAADGGSQELEMAQKYLKPGHNQRESSEAARWLWKSVSKQNSRAAYMLADLYVRGDGVSRNCDEARILLGAAAKKGLTEAAQKLSSLDSNCH